MRIQLVNPVLRCLGWDPEEPTQVIHNMPGKEGTPDYTLLKGGKTVLFLETKNLKVDVDDEKALDQLSGYCSSVGCDYGVVTNGRAWLLLRAFQSGKKAKDRIICKRDLERDGVQELVNLLEWIEYGRIERLKEFEEQNQLELIWSHIFEDTTPAVVNALAGVLREECKAQGVEVSEGNLENFILMKLRSLLKLKTEAEPAAISGGEEGLEWGSIPGPAQPSYLRLETYEFSDGKRITPRYWNEILKETAEWLISKGKLECPYYSSKMSYLVNSEPIRRVADGKKMLNPAKLSNGWYIETNYSSSDIIFYANRMLEDAGYPKLKVIKTPNNS